MRSLADSNITKRALAESLKNLMKTQPFSQISVGHICEACNMNRKSFYYHFKDKYDLINWIYRTEFIAVARKRQYGDGWHLMEDLCAYFYDNRDFYRKTFQIEGQNSFSDYFREIVAMVITNDVEEIFGNNDDLDFCVDFYADACVCAIKRWLSEKNCDSAEIFSKRIKRCLLQVSDKIVVDYMETDEK